MIKIVKKPASTTRTSQYNLEFGERIMAFETAKMNYAWDRFREEENLTYSKMTPSLKSKFHRSRFYKQAQLEINAAKAVAMEPIVMAVVKALPTMEFTVSNDMGTPDDLKRFRAVIEAVKKA